MTKLSIYYEESIPNFNDSPIYQGNIERFNDYYNEYKDFIPYAVIVIHKDGEHFRFDPVNMEIEKIESFPTDKRCKIYDFTKIFDYLSFIIKQYPELKDYWKELLEK